MVQNPVTFSNILLRGLLLLISLPLFLGYNEAEMQQMGFRLTADDVYSVNHHSMKDGIVLFGGGCTGELISPDGLLITNHHCGYSFVQRHSSVEHNYLHNGFWSKSREEELVTSGLTVTFLVRMEDVTSVALKDVTASMTESERTKQVEKNIKEITKAAIDGTHYTAIVKPFFYGNQYFLFVNEVFRDVRLVGVPPESIGKLPPSWTAPPAKSRSCVRARGTWNFCINQPFLRCFGKSSTHSAQGFWEQS